jgi:hypothetical protein
MKMEIINEIPFPFLRFVLLFKPIIKYFRTLYEVYIKGLGLDSITWTDAHVYRLTRNKYKPENVLNKIAFIVPLNWALQHLEPIFPYLKKEEFDIITVTHGDSVLENNIQKYTEKYQCSWLSINEVINRKLYYKLAVTPDIRPTRSTYKNGKIIYGVNLIAEKKLRVIFRVGSLNGMFDKPQSMIVDYLACSGEYHKKNYERMGTKAKIFVSGSPRFENFNLDTAHNKGEILKENNLDIDPNKKTILWLPGHTVFTSVIEFASLVAKINDFNIILKPHPYLYKEIDDLDTLLCSLMPNIKILKDVNNIEILPLADFVLCDYGGSVFTAIQADKNILFFNTKKMKRLKKWNGLDCPEIELRKRIINFNKNHEKELIAALYDDTVWKKQKEIRKQIRAEYFTENEHAAQDIADFLRKIVKGTI